MSQFDPSAYVDTESGSQLVSRLNSSFDAFLSLHQGTSRPSYAVDGTMWLDTDTPGGGEESLLFYDGAADITLLEIDTTNDRVSQVGDLLSFTGTAATLAASNDGADVSLTLGNTAGGGSTDETVTLAFQHNGLQAGYIQSIRKGNYSSAGNENSTFAIGLSNSGSDQEVMRAVIFAANTAQWLFNDTANANSNGGITINQGAFDDELFAGKSSDVAHGMTDETETDTYTFQKKLAAASGGLYLEGLSAAAQAMILVASGTGEATDDDSGSAAQLDVRGRKKSGTTVAALGSTGNVLAIRNHLTGIVLFKGDGTVHAADTSWATALDDQDDIRLARTLTRFVSRKGYVQSRWDEMITGHADELRAAGILGSVHPEKGRSDMVALQPTIMLSLGVGWQNYEKIMEDRARIGVLVEEIETRVPGFLAAVEARLAEQQLPAIES